MERKQTLSFIPLKETTADGSPTLYRSDLDEHYHSMKGALAESLHVYIGLGWKPASEIFNPLNVFEVGFGTGLNATLTANAAMKSKVKTLYTAIELYPLPPDFTEMLLPLQPEECQEWYKAVNEAPWDTEIEINPYFTLRKIHGNLLTEDIPAGQNVVYFDAFAPEKQPEMWSEEIFRKIFSSMTENGILTTYCAKGNVRRMLTGIGFRVERLPGPPGGKREVLRANICEYLHEI